MEQTENKNIRKTFAINGNSVLTKISKLMETGSQSGQLVIAVYHLEQNRFLYYNAAFKKLLGTNMNQILEHGWDYWFMKICPEECRVIKKKLSTFFSAPFAQNSAALRYHILDAHENMIFVMHEIVLHKFNKGTMAINYFFDISEKERIERCLNSQNQNGLFQIVKDFRPISPREKEVLKLIADGFSSKQIADQLFISNHTAISHRKHLIEKFQVKNTAQLIKKASRVIDL